MHHFSWGGGVHPDYDTPPCHTHVTSLSVDIGDDRSTGVVTITQYLFLATHQPQTDWCAVDFFSNDTFRMDGISRVIER